jgi:aminoglycoside phosphotransferase (APT) family kinase protein
VGGDARERRVVRLNRLPHELVDWQLYADRLVSNALGHAGIAHARVLEIDCTRRDVPTDFEILEHMAGAPLSTLDADDHALVPWLARLAIALRSVHALPGREFGFLDVAEAAHGQERGLRGVHARWDQFVLLRLASHVQTLREAGLVAAGEAGRIAGAFEAARDALAAVEPRLLHGDPGNHNVIVRDGEVPRLVDWEDALLGDPLFDVAFWATFHPERRWPAFFEAYFGPGWRPTRRFWLYFLRVALSKTVHRLRFGYADAPGRPPAAARIQRGLAGLAATEGEPA